jgi:hypothetical protein
VGHDQRHDHVQLRERAVGKRVETVPGPQGVVEVLALGSVEIKEAGILDGDDPRVGHLLRARVEVHDVSGAGGNSEQNVASPPAMRSGIGRVYSGLSGWRKKVHVALLTLEKSKA